MSQCDRSQDLLDQLDQLNLLDPKVSVFGLFDSCFCADMFVLYLLSAFKMAASGISPSLSRRVRPVNSLLQ